MQQPPQHMDYLDGWRGLAIICVLVAHFGPKIADPLGSLGVELFFVLSGRLMALMLLQRRTPYGTFFFRRASRILPALWFYCLCAALFMVGAGHGNFTAWQWFGVATFTVNYQAISGEAPELLRQVWSLCIEEYAYASLAVICAVGLRDAKRAGWIALAVSLIAMANGLRLYLDGVGGILEVYWRTDVRIASVTLSFAIATLFSPRIFWLPLICGLAMFYGPIPGRFVMGTALLALAVNAIDHAHYRWLFENRAMIFFGLISYSLYLWQHAFYRLEVGWLGAPLSVLFALGSFHLLEQPARTKLNQWWKQRFMTSRAVA